LDRLGQQHKMQKLWQPSKLDMIMEINHIDLDNSNRRKEQANAYHI
jgi:hypothetical protein